MADVFLSYNRQDQQLAQLYADAMEREGLNVWWDQTLKSGQAYDHVTEAALRAAKAVVVLWSPRSIASRWVRSEATIADRNGTLLPVMTEPCDRPVMFELIQTADLIHWRGEPDDRAWLQFVDEVRSLVGHEVTQRPKPAAAAPVLALPDKPSIAVLPFANLSGDPEQAYFVDGLMEEIVTSLTRIQSIFVIASGTMLSFKGQNMAPIEAARQLGVRYVLEGSVRKAGNRVRIAVKLIDATTSTQIWADRFEGNLDDIFELQDNVALGVAGVIEYSVQGAETKRSLARRTEDLGAYDLRLQAVARMRTYRREDLYAALDLVERALALESDNPWAAAMAASCHVIILQYQWTDDPALHGRQLHQQIESALKRGGNDAEVVATAAMVHWANADFARAAQLAARAISLNPGSSWALLAHGMANVALGNPQVAEESFSQSMRLDPISPNRNLQIGGMGATYFAQRRYAESAELAHEYAELTQQPMSFGLSAAAYGQLGNIKQAAESLRLLRTITPMPIEALAGMFYQKPEHRALFLEGIKMAESTVQEV